MAERFKAAPAARAAVDINARIAAQVRALRAESGLSLDALAAKCGVSRSMLSLVERGESSPTASVLERIATGLGVSLATLFEDRAHKSEPLSRKADRQPWRDPRSGYVRVNISPPNYPSPLQLAQITLPAGARVAYENGDGNLHQQVWVQSGNVEITVGSQTYALGPDDCLAMRLSEPTVFHNRTRKSARYVVALATEHVRARRSHGE